MRCSGPTPSSAAIYTPLPPNPETAGGGVLPTRSVGKDARVAAGFGIARASASSAAAETPWETTRRGVPLSLEHTNLISIDSFPAEFSVLDGTGQRTWCACTVVGLTSDEHAPRFVVLVDSGDLAYATTVPEVRRVEAAPV